MKYVSSSHDPSLRTICSRNGGSRVDPCCCVLLLSCSSFSTLTNQQSRYKKLENYANKEMQKCKAELYSNLISTNKSNPSALWKTLNEITSHKQCSPISCIEADGVAHCDNPSIAKILNVHFCTIGSKLAMKLKSFVTQPSPLASSTDLPKFVFKPITEEFVRGQLKQLRNNKATVDNILDNISARLLKDIG